MTDNNHSDLDLNAQLDSYHVAAPSDLLSARIAKAAIQVPQDAAPMKRAPYAQLVAALTVMFAVGFGAYSVYDTIAVTEDESVWMEAATDLGVSDVYNWVYAEMDSGS